MQVNGKHYRTVWLEGGLVKMINQPLIPHAFEIFESAGYEETAWAIKTMVVRGAGAIGATAGFAMAQAALMAPDGRIAAHMREAADVIRATRPTAQNLFYAVERVLAAAGSASAGDRRSAAVAEADAIADEDAAACQAIGQLGAEEVHDGCRILTHCNAGWLAFVDWGTALSPVYAARRQDKKVFVFVDETRPRCQGARLTAWELCGEGVDHAIIADNAAGFYMRKGDVHMVIVGADRIAANGDVANKIGTYTKAVLAKENGVPFYVAAPTSTIDMLCPSGDDIPIEQRGEDEVLCMFGLTDASELVKVRLAPRQSKARNPAFDVTPAKYITGIITEKGIIEPGNLTNLS
jgi:S-methyl-5-thioribose-1-phosphate isomerase